MQKFGIVNLRKDSNKKVVEWSDSFDGIEYGFKKEGITEVESPAAVKHLLGKHQQWLKLCGAADTDIFTGKILLKNKKKDDMGNIVSWIAGFDGTDYLFGQEPTDIENAKAVQFLLKTYPKWLEIHMETIASKESNTIKK